MYENCLSYPKFLLFGDSITEYCYDQLPVDLTTVQFSLGAALSNIYTRKLDIVQRGFSGYNTEFSRIILPKILALEHDNESEGSKIKIMTLFLGSNDAAFGGPERVEKARFIENMNFLIEYVLSKKIKLILIGPLWHNTERYRKFEPEEYERGIYRTTENNKIYSDLLRSCAEKFEVPFICLQDKFAQYSNHSDYNELLSDGLHLSGKGYKMLFDSIMDVIEDNYPELHPSNIKPKLPSWSDPKIIEILKNV